MSYVIGIDNGVSGYITVMDATGAVALHEPMPTKSEQSYTKAKQNITRIDAVRLRGMLDVGGPQGYKPHCNNLAVLERPMTNPGRLKAMFSGMRALEATLIVLEELGVPYRYIDSKEWQRAMLPEGCGKGETKKAAADIARRLFPHVKTKDADSLLIAEYARRTYR